MPVFPIKILIFVIFAALVKSAFLDSSLVFDSGMVSRQDVHIHPVFPVNSSEMPQGVPLCSL